jgi:hypothetical protein
MPLHPLMFMFTSVKSGTSISYALEDDLPDEYDCLFRHGIRFDHECPSFVE